MEMIQGTHKASNFAPQDYISNMPDNVITSILDRLPLQDAVRTDILSKNWRHKWTMITHLVLDDDFFDCLSETEEESNHVRIVSRLLLHLRGPITKCVISLGDLDYSRLDIEDINHWISFLSRNEIKDLEFLNVIPQRCMFPANLFSCLGLTHLKLVNCRVHRPTTFHGFPNLLSLEFLLATFESWKLGEFLTLCPVLETLKMSNPGNTVKLDDIAKIANLKILSLNLGNLEHKTITSFSAIFELLGFLPTVQKLDLVFPSCKLTEGGAKKKFPASFPCLKALKLSNIDTGRVIMVSCVLEMIGHLPNLQTLEIVASSTSLTEGGAKKRFPDAFPCLKALTLSHIDVGSVNMLSCVFEMIRHLSNLQNLKIIADNGSGVDSFPEVDYNTMGPLQLRSVVFISLIGSENELCLIKYFLACSPFLKKIAFRPGQSLASHEQMMFATKLFKLQRAYPGVDIGLC